MTQESPEGKQPPVWKQLMGAGVGMMVALGLYYGYKAAAPAVQAYLLPPGGITRSALQGETSFADKGVAPQSEQARRVAARTRELALKMLENRPQETLASDTVAPAAQQEPIAQAPAPAPVAEAPAEEEEFSLMNFEPVRLDQAEAASSSARTIHALNRKAPLVEEPAKAAAWPEHGDNTPDQLPSSGLELWLLTALALGAAVMSVPRARARVMLAVGL
jgi:hypothetical protein